jgi:hypothetical protein
MPGPDTKKSVQIHNTAGTGNNQGYGSNLISDPDTNMQIISDPAGAGSTTLLVTQGTKSRKYL